jgi:hypothetical protein
VDTHDDLAISTRYRWFTDLKSPLLEPARVPPIAAGSRAAVRCLALLGGSPKVLGIPEGVDR